MDWMIPVAVLVLGFAIRDVWWENRKRIMDYDRGRLTECYSPLFMRLYMGADMLSGTFARDQLLPIVQKYGYMLRPDSVQAFHALLEGERAFAELMSDKTGNELGPDVVESLSRRIQSGLDPVAALREMPTDQRDAVLKALRFVVDWPKIEPILDQLTDRFSGFWLSILDEFNRLAADYHALRGTIPSTVEPPKWIRDRSSRLLNRGKAA